MEDGSLKYVVTSKAVKQIENYSDFLANTISHQFAKSKFFFDFDSQFNLDFWLAKKGQSIFGT